MKISDVIKQTLDIVQKKPLERSSGDNTSDFTAFTGDLQPVELQDTKVEAPERAGKTPSGNDKSPEDLYVPPLQQKLELLKKAVDVENIYDDGPPDVQYQATDDGEWRGADNKHEYIGAPWTAEQVEGATEGTEQPDPNEGEEEDRKRADEDLERMRRFTNLGEEKSPKAKKDWDGDGKIESEKDEVIGSRRKAAGLDEEIDTGEYDARKSTPRNKDDQDAVFKRHFDRVRNTDWSEFDDKDEQLDEQSEDLGRIRQLAGLNPVVLDELASDFPDE